MQRTAIRLAILLIAALIVASQFAIPPYVSNQVADRLTAGGGVAKVELHAFPAVQLLWGHGRDLKIAANGLSVDLKQNQGEVFKRLDGFTHVTIDVRNARAGPFTIRGFSIRKLASHSYLMGVVGDATAGDVARYAGAQLGGGLGQDLAGLAAAALGSFDRSIPFNARMRIATDSGNPTADHVVGTVDGFPAGPLGQVVANALLSGL